MIDEKPWRNNVEFLRRPPAVRLMSLGQALRTLVCTDAARKLARCLARARERSCPSRCVFILRIVGRERNRLSRRLSRAESQHDLFLAVRVLLSPEFQQQGIHLRKNHLRPLYLGMTARAE
jgi:hypothetical protein